VCWKLGTVRRCNIFVIRLTRNSAVDTEIQKKNGRMKSKKKIVQEIGKKCSFVKQYKMSESERHGSWLVCTGCFLFVFFSYFGLEHFLDDRRFTRRSRMACRTADRLSSAPGGSPSQSTARKTGDGSTRRGGRSCTDFRTCRSGIRTDTDRDKERS